VEAASVLSVGTKAERLRPAPEAAEPADEPTWKDAHALLAVEITDADRLHLFAGDGDEEPEAPESVRRDPTLLLAWCRYYQPDMLLDDATALVNARNRCMSEIVHSIRHRDPKRRINPKDVIEHLKATLHDRPT
jgi:hypothetical protein